MTNATLATGNEDWGFYGTIARGTDVDPGAAWRLAFAKVAAATGASAEGVRDFLDSRHGRHFADEVANGLLGGNTLSAAIDAATTRWMGWTIDRRTSRESGIPQGLPYLTGWVTHFAIEAEQVD